MEDWKKDFSNFDTADSGTTSTIQTIFTRGTASANQQNSVIL